jgi:hypothetical protein
MANLNLKQVSYDFVRIHYKVDLAKALKETSTLCELLEKNVTLWREAASRAYKELVYLGEV